MRTLFITLSAIAVFTSCSNEEKKVEKPTVVFTNHMEPDEWTVGPTKEVSNAHSGKFVTLIDSITPYSIGIVKQLKELSTQPIDSITFSFWVFMQNATADAKTVFSIDDLNGKNIAWVGNPLKDKVKEISKWVEVKETFVFPPKIDNLNKLKIYVWNTSKEEILLDDFQVTFH